MKRSLIASAAILALSALVLDASLAAGSGKPPPKVEAANNLSFPLILSDGVGPTLPGDAAWRFATITNFGTQCIGEEGVTPGTPVDPNYLCYYGRRVTVVPETGEIQFTEPTKVWWLQKRPANFWKALTVAHDPSTPLVVSAVDVGDLLESSPAIGTRRIRVEFNMLQHVATTDPEFGPMVVPSWNIGVPSPCVVPSDSTTSIGCFAAVDMSGAVPGTEQSGNEIQGTDFGPGGQGGQPGTRMLIDPATVRTTTPDLGGIQAIVYSRCARLLIQKVTGVPIWLPDLGRWNGKSLPVVDAARLTESRRSTGATHLDRLRNWIEDTDAIEHDLPIVTVPELFARASGPRVVSLVADALTDELDPDPVPTTRRGRQRGTNGRGTS